MTREEIAHLLRHAEGTDATLRAMRLAMLYLLEQAPDGVAPLAGREVSGG